jgi:RNA polymerase sigma-70 factor, ECF subfamily
MLSLLKNRTQVADKSTTFEAMMRDSYRQAYTVAYRLTGDSNDAEDLLQEAYVRAFRFFHRYDSTLPFISWLYRIISNSHIDLVRRKGKIKALSLDQSGSDGTQAYEVADNTYNPSRELLDNSFTDVVQTGLNQMNSEFRMAVILTDIEGMSYEEVADIMETSIGTVRSRIHRGRTQLKSFLLKTAPGTYARYDNEL